MYKRHRSRELDVGRMRSRRGLVRTVVGLLVLHRDPVGPSGHGAKPCDEYQYVVRDHLPRGLIQRHATPGA